MKSKPTSNKSQTNFTKLDQLSDDEIDFSDLEEVTPDMFAKAVVRQGLKPIAHKHNSGFEEETD